MDSGNTQAQVLLLGLHSTALVDILTITDGHFAVGLTDGKSCTHLCATLPFLMSEMIKGSPSFLLAAAKETYSTKLGVEFAVQDRDGGWLMGRSSHKKRGFIFP